MNCYKAAMAYFKPVWNLPIRDIDIDDLQECMDDCPHGKRTKQNMKAMCGLVYKYGIPRHVIPENLNLAPFLLVDGDGAAHRAAFDDAQLDKIKKACGTIPHADEIYIMCYLGFRPSEMLALTADDYDKAHDCLIGGAKTDAGKGRAVTISPKIKTLVADRVASGGPLFQEKPGKSWTLKRYTELQDEKYHIDCYKYDCFYAFGQKQFDENKKRISPLRDGEKYVSAGAGLYGTRDGLDRLFAALKDIDEKIKQECDPQEVYFYEYNNHECQISWDGDIEPYNIILRIWGKEIASKIVRV
jgi:hypothetical protein